MFGGWDEATLKKVLEANGGDTERAVDAILAAGSPEAWAASQRKRVELPADFLRVPGRAYERTDEEIAMALQQEDLVAPPRQQQSVGSMLASVGTSMRAGVASASTRLHNFTRSLSKKKDDEPPPYDTVVDVGEELRDDEPPLDRHVPTQQQQQQQDDDDYEETVAV